MEDMFDAWKNDVMTLLISHVEDELRDSQTPRQLGVGPRAMLKCESDDLNWRSVDTPTL